MTPEKLKEFRDKIDALDDKILPLLSERALLVQEVGRNKKDSNAHIFRPEREVAIIERLIKNNKGPLSRHTIAVLWLELISGSRALERVLNIALEKENMSAALALFGHRCNIFYQEKIEDIFNLLAFNKIEAGVFKCSETRNSDIFFNINLLTNLIHYKKNIVSEINIPNLNKSEITTSKRYLAVADFVPHRCDYDKTTVILRPKNLSDVTSIIESTNLILTDKCSVNYRSQSWLWLDFSGHIEDSIVAEGLNTLEAHSEEFHHLGSYPLFDSVAQSCEKTSNEAPA